MTNPPYTRSFTVGWGDLDANGHMKNTAYLDTCVEVRFGFFASRGLGPAEFAALGIFAILRRDEVDYLRELRFLDEYTVDLELAGMSEDTSRFAFRNHFHRADGQAAAVVRSIGGWMDLETRRLIAPPRPVRNALLELPRGGDYEIFPSSLR